MVRCVVGVVWCRAHDDQRFGVFGEMADVILDDEQLQELQFRCHQAVAWKSCWVLQSCCANFATI